MAIDDATVQEIELLKNEIKSKEIVLEAEKNSYKRQLMGFSEQMMKELENPPKDNFFLKLKVKWARWRRKRKDTKILKGTRN